MLKNLAFTMLTAVYYSVIPVYCFMQLFSCTDKFKIYIHVLASFFILWALQFIKLYEHASEATTLSQLFIFLNVFFLFRGPVKQKLLSYFKDEGLAPESFALEMTLIDYGLTHDQSQFITEIQIPLNPDCPGIIA